MSNIYYNMFGLMKMGEREGRKEKDAPPFTYLDEK